MRNKLGLLTALLLALAVGTAEAQQRTIRGTVVDSTTNQPVANASVSVEGTTIGVIAERDGSFVLRGVPAGGVTLLVQRIGFRSRRVDVPAGQDRVTIRLSTDYLRLEELVVTGRATEMERRNLATSISTVQGGEVDRTSQQTVDKALQGRVAGAMVARNSGAPGGGVQVQLRGPSSINARSAPLYVIDGVLVSNEAIQPNANAITEAATGSNPSLDQDNPVNRIADLNPKDIESIEVLKGPAAAAIYGQKASNGVIIIETKRGSASGAPQWRLTARGGFFDVSNTIGSRVFETRQEAEDAFGSTLAQEWEDNSNQFFDGGTPVFDHEEKLASRNDFSWEGSASLSGGLPAGVNYYASVLGKEDEGIVANTGFDKQALRVNLGEDLGDRGTINFSSNLIRTEARRGLTNNDNAQVSYYMVLSATPSFVDLEQRSDGSWPCNVAVGNCSNPLQTAELVDKSEEVFRLMGSSNLDFSLVEADRHDVTLRATGGVDWFGQTNDIFSPPELNFEPADGFPGTKVLSKTDNLQFNVNVNGVWDFAVADGTSLTTSSGFQYEFSELNINRTTGKNLTGGKNKVDAATVISPRQLKEKIEDFGFYVQEQLLTLDERLLVTGAVRFDQSSANADNDELFIFPQATASFRFPDLGGFFDELKIRGAYGETGNRPLFGQEFTSLELTENIEGIPGFTIEGDVGAADLQPERQREFEGGFDLTALDGRGRLEVTAYLQRISDLILQRQLAPSSGFNTKIFNGGELESRGLEVSLNATPVVTNDLEWSVRGSFDVNRTEVIDLPVPSFLTGAFGAALGEFRVEEGKSLTQIVGTDPRPVAGDDGLVQLGNANPDFSLGLGSDLRWQGFTLYQLWDWRPGFEVINLTEFLYDAAGVSPDFEDPDGTISSPTECFPGCSGQERLAGLGGGFARPYVQDAGFLKLREASVGWEVPESVRQAIWGGFESVRLTLSGRNLITVTDYRGLDPEVSNFGAENFARNVDVAPFPPSRSFWLSLDLSF